MLWDHVLYKQQFYDILLYKHHRNTIQQGSKLLQNQYSENTESIPYLKPGEIFNKWIDRVMHQFKQLVLLYVFVLIQESRHSVGDSPGIVLYSKLNLPA